MPISHSSDSWVYEFGAQGEKTHGHMFGTHCSIHNISSSATEWDYTGGMFWEIIY